GQRGRRRSKVFCQGCRGDRDEPDHGKKGTLDHENLLIPARRMLASLRVNVGPLGLRPLSAKSRIPAGELFLVVAHTTNLIADLRIEGVLLEGLVRAGSRPPVGGHFYRSPCLPLMSLSCLPLFM